MSSINEFHDALIGQAMIERARSVIVVARRVDENQAGQILFDAARLADIPVHLAADQVMIALRSDAELQSDAEEKTVQDTLARALESVHPVDRQQSHDSLDVPRSADRVA